MAFTETTTTYNRCTPNTCTDNIDCECKVLLSTDCITYTGDDLPCSGIKKNTIETNMWQQMDAFICRKFSEFTASVSLLSLGLGAKIYKGVDPSNGTSLFRSLTKTGNLVTVTENINDIGISINETNLSAFVKSNQNNTPILSNTDELPEGNNNLYVSIIDRTKIRAITEIFTTALKTNYDNAYNWVVTNGANVLSHLTNINNPHLVTKTQVGLSNISNIRFTDGGDTNSLFIGTGTGASNIPVLPNSGVYNTFIGQQAGFKNTTGYAKLSVGYGAGYNETTANGCVNVGYQSGFNNAVGNFNTNLGVDAGARNKGSMNVFLGHHSGFGFSTFSTGNQNNLIGVDTGVSLLTGFGNNGVGYRTFYNLTNGYNNCAFGDLAGFNLSTGISNCLFGRDAGFTLTTQSSNVIMGQRAGYFLTGGSNTILGDLAGNVLTSASRNVFIGVNSGSSASQKVDAVNSIAIGNGAFTTKNNQVVLGADTIVETILQGAVNFQSINLTGLNTAPLSATDTGNEGEIRVTVDYIYVCKLPNTWVRTPLSTW